MNHVYILGGLRSYIGVKDGMYRHIPAEKLGAEVRRDEGVATVTKEGQTIVFQIGEAECLVNGRPEQMIAPAQLIGEKTMVPLRFLSETLGYQVSWDEPTKTAFVIG